jgi:hypothetical protein
MRDGDAGRRLATKAPIDVGDRGEPVAGEVHELRPVDLGHTLEDVGSIVLVGDSAARAVSLEQSLHRCADPDREPGERGEVVQILLIAEDGAVGGGEPEAALAGIGPRVIGGHEARDGLLLEPLAHIPLGGAGACSQLARRQLRSVGESAVEAKPVTDVDGCDLERVDRGREQALDERLGRFGH